MLASAQVLSGREGLVKWTHTLVHKNYTQKMLLDLDVGLFSAESYYIACN